MSPVRDLSPQTCDIIRTTEAQVRDVGNPTVTETAVATKVPCRFDREAQRAISNMISGEMRTLQIVGRVFIDAVVLPVAIDEDDTIVISGRKYEIYALIPEYGYSTIDHYEIDVVDYHGE